MHSAISSSCGCSSSSIKPVVSSRVAPMDGYKRYSMLSVRQRGKLANAISLRAERKSLSGKLGRSCDGIVIVRAEIAGGGGSLDETLKDVNSEKAVESMQGFDRSTRLMVDNLKPEENPGTTSPRDLEPQAEEKPSETDKPFVGKETVLEVASDSAVEPEHTHANAVAKADELVPELGRSVKDLTTALEDRAEKASNKDAELLRTDEGTSKSGGGIGQVIDLSKESRVPGEGNRQTEAETGVLTRDDANEKIVNIAREGIEVLKWAAEGVISAGANSREGLEAAKGTIDKRVKSFSTAAEETREVSAQLSEAAKKKYEELQGSAAKFNEELQVQTEDRKAADELKPDSERNPLVQLSRGVQAAIEVVTKEDGPLARLLHSLQENFAKLSSAGQKFASNSSSKGATEELKQDSDNLVPVGENEGFFQDLAPANGSSPKPGDRSTEASDILGQHNATDQEEGEKKDRQEYLGDIPDDSSAWSSKSDTEQTLTNSIKEQTPTISGNASAVMRDEYEHEVGNDQLQGTKQPGLETNSTDAGGEHDPAVVRPSIKDKDEMGIGPDE